ncbi:MAG: PP2C family protein-serine/threonine phosphatase [Phycisphaerales bacterium JB040]
MVQGRGEFEVLLTASPLLSERLDPESILSPVLLSWPMGMLRPSVRVTTWDSVRNPAGHREGVLVVLLSKHERDSTLAVLEGYVEESMGAVLVLTEPSDKPTAVLGAPTLPWCTDPAHIATSLATLAARQEVIDRIAREHRLSRMMLDGVQRQLIEWNAEMRRAASVQREFLPSANCGAGLVDLGVVYRPAGDVSGDVYDLRRLDDDTIAFFIADAVGHGVPAAMMTQIIARSLRMTEGVGDSERILSPVEALERLNDELVRHGGSSSRFATAVYGLIDAPTGRVRLAGAGHPPPIVCGPSGSRRIETGGPLLGVFEEAEFGEAEFTLSPGEVLVLFSDGFEMAFPDEGATGEDLKRPTRTHLEKLASVSASGGAGGVREAALRLNAELDSQVGSLHQPDDVTALLISPVAQEARLAA